MDIMGPAYVLQVPSESTLRISRTQDLFITNAVSDFLALTYIFSRHEFIIVCGVLIYSLDLQIMLG